MIIFEKQKQNEMKISALNLSVSKINCSPISLFVQKSASGSCIQIFAKINVAVIEIVDEISLKIS